MYLAATAPTNVERLAHLADGAAYPAVRPEIVLRTEILCAGADVINAFHWNVAPMIDKIEANKAENRTHSITRDLLLPKLMSGEIRVEDAEKMLEAAS